MVWYWWKREFDQRYCNVCVLSHLATKFNLQTSSIWVTWELIKNAEPQAPCQTYRFRMIDPELLPIWEGPQTLCFPRCHRLVSLSHLEGRAGLQLVVFQFPQGMWTWALALWPGRIELFGPRDGDRNTMSSITWPVDVMFGWIPQFSRVALTLYYLVHSQLIHLSSGPQKH